MLTHGIRNGSLVRIDEIGPEEWGARCGCICPNADCQEPLIAKSRDFPGRKQVKYFAHESGAECTGANETIVHLLAKAIIADAAAVGAPAVSLERTPPNWTNDVITPPGRLQFDQVEVETGADHLRPDLIGIAGGKRWMLEIKVTHEVDSAKRDHARKSGWTMLEIDASAFTQEEEVDEEALRRHLLDGHDGRVWINHAERGPMTDQLLSLATRVPFGAACLKGIGALPADFVSIPSAADEGVAAPCQSCPFYLGIEDQSVLCLSTVEIDSAEAYREHLGGVKSITPVRFNLFRQRLEQRRYRKAVTTIKAAYASTFHDRIRNVWEKIPPSRRPQQVDADVLWNTLQRLSSTILSIYKDGRGGSPLCYLIYLVENRPVPGARVSFFKAFEVGADSIREVKKHGRPSFDTGIGLLFMSDRGYEVILDEPEGAVHERLLRL